jgi:signal transduction histidine kinase
MPQTASPAAPASDLDSPEWKLLEAGSLLAQFGSFGLIWMKRDLTVDDTFGPLVDFVTVGEPITSSVLALIGLEAEILGLADDTTRVLELPAVAAMSGTNQAGKLNFTLFWNAGRDCPMALAYKSASQTELEFELSKQIRARLMAEAEVTLKSKELARANADLESFAAIISHDLKAPLRHMRQLTETAFDTATDVNTAAVLETLRNIERQSRRMSDMLTALLDYSTLGRKYEAIEAVDTSKLIDAIVHSLPDSGHTFEVTGDWPVFETLRAPLDLILRNLIANALQHHDKPSGKISLNCEDRAQKVVFSVSDDGPGIAQQYHEVIFLPFRTLKSGLEQASTGMGLAAVKKTIEAAGGSIEVISAPGQQRGTTFNVYWPKVVVP